MKNVETEVVVQNILLYLCGMPMQQQRVRRACRSRGRTVVVGSVAGQLKMGWPHHRNNLWTILDVLLNILNTGI